MQAKLKIVYVITKRDNRAYWNRIGIAFEAPDGSLNVKLEAIPISGEMHIRDFIPRRDTVTPIRSTTGSTNAPRAETPELAELA